MITFDSVAPLGSLVRASNGRAYVRRSLSVFGRTGYALLTPAWPGTHGPASTIIARTTN